MVRPIDADTFMIALDNECSDVCQMDGDLYAVHGYTFDHIKRVLDKQPTLDYKPVKHAKWVHTDMAATWTAKDECSNCHYHTKERLDLSIFMYCPMCGCDMEVED